MASITSANAVLTMTVRSLFTSPVPIQGFMTDDIYTAEALEVAETMMGVDGKLSGGFVYSPQTVGFALQADSPSVAFFDQWYLAQRQAVDLYYADGIIRLKSIGTSFTLTKGILKTYPAITEASRTLKGRRFTLVWESVTPSPI